jgi:hypothetical protein
LRFVLRLGATFSAFSLWLVIAAAVAFLAFPAAATAALIQVTVRDFFFGRSAHLLDSHVKIEMLTSERVVAIDCYVVLFDLYNAN